MTNLSYLWLNTKAYVAVNVILWAHNLNCVLQELLLKHLRLWQSHQMLCVYIYIAIQGWWGGSQSRVWQLPHGSGSRGGADGELQAGPWWAQIQPCISLAGQLYRSGLQSGLCSAVWRTPLQCGTSGVCCITFVNAVKHCHILVSFGVSRLGHAMKLCKLKGPQSDIICAWMFADHRVWGGLRREWCHISDFWPRVQHALTISCRTLRIGREAACHICLACICAGLLYF